MFSDVISGCGCGLFRINYIPASGFLTALTAPA
jgi:hypothetical protein